MKNVGNILKMICDFKNSQEFYFLVPTSQRLISVGNLEMVAHSAYPKRYLYLIYYVIGTEIGFMCSETVRAL